jgi:hypothetical protein
MSYTIQQLAFILYNNRSVEGVVKNFIPENINPLILQRVEINLDKSKSKYRLDDRLVEVNINEFDLEVDDVIVKKEYLSELSELFIENIGNFSDKEFDYLIHRGVGEDTILKWKLLGLSSIKDKKHLEIIGATCHPTTKKFLQDGIEGGGIIIPLFDENEILVNCAIRKINSHKSLKYSLACPDTPVWGLDEIDSDEQEMWICEGIFDMMALSKMNKKAVSCSSAMWSGIQLYQLLIKKPKLVNIFSDNDEVGLRTSAILRDFFQISNIESKIFVSRVAKDPAEHYFQKYRNMSDLIEIEVDEKLIESRKDESFNFIEYLKNRKY